MDQMTGSGLDYLIRSELVQSGRAELAVLVMALAALMALDIGVFVLNVMDVEVGVVVVVAAIDRDLATVNRHSDFVLSSIARGPVRVQGKQRQTPAE